MYIIPKYLNDVGNYAEVAEILSKRFETDVLAEPPEELDRRVMDALNALGEKELARMYERGELGAV